MKRLPVCSVIYRSEAVGNINPHPAADFVYYPFKVVDADGEVFDALATREDLARMIERGRKNREDVGPAAGSVRRLLAWLLR